MQASRELIQLPAIKASLAKLQRSRPMIAATIRAPRAGLDWRQARLAAEAGLQPKSVAYWERMSGEMPVNRNRAPCKMKEALARAGAAIEGNVVRFHMAAGCSLG